MKQTETFIFKIDSELDAAIQLEKEPRKISNRILPSSSAITTSAVPGSATALGSVDDTDTVNSNWWLGCLQVSLHDYFKLTGLLDTFTVVFSFNTAVCFIEVHCYGNETLILVCENFTGSQLIKI